MSVKLFVLRGIAGTVFASGLIGGGYYALTSTPYHQSSQSHNNAQSLVAPDNTSSRPTLPKASEASKFLGAITQKLPWRHLATPKPQPVETASASQETSSSEPSNDTGVVANWEDISYGLTRPANYKEAPQTWHGKVTASISREIAQTEQKVINIKNIAKTATDCLAVAIAGEARGEVVTGQVGVANVVYNRVNTWGGSECVNVFAHNASGCQFYGACRGRHFSQDVMDRARTIAAAQLSGSLKDVTGGALYFHVCRDSATREKEKSQGKKVDFTTKIEHHCYYRDKDSDTTTASPVQYDLVRDESAPYNYRLEETRL